MRRFGSNCIAVNAMREVGANVLEVEKRLKKANQDLNQNLLHGQGLELVQVYDESDYITSSVSLVRALSTSRSRARNDGFSITGSVDRNGNRAAIALR